LAETDGKRAESGLKAGEKGAESRPGPLLHLGRSTIIAVAGPEPAPEAALDLLEYQSGGWETFGA